MPASLPESASAKEREKPPAKEEISPIVEVGRPPELPEETKKLLERVVGPEQEIAPLRFKGEVLAAPTEEELVMPTSWQKFQQGLRLAPEFTLAWLAELVERLRKIASFRHWKVFWRGQ